MGCNPILEGPWNLISLCSTPCRPQSTLSSHDPQRAFSFPMTRGLSLTRLPRSQRYGTEAGKGGQMAWWQMPRTVPRKKSLKTVVHLSAQPETNVSSGVNGGTADGTPQVHTVPWDVPAGQAPGHLPCCEITHCLAVLSPEGSILGSQPPQKGTKQKRKHQQGGGTPNRQRGPHKHSGHRKARLLGPLPRGAVLC